MSISSRIEAIEQHLTDDYSVLTLAGADLTNVDKNIENLKQAWEERLLYFLANGTDVVWNNWLPKVNGTGENITLNNTIEAKMDFVYKGNTYQYSTTSANLLPQDKYIESTTKNGITFTNNGDGTFNLVGTASANTTLPIIPENVLDLTAGQPYYLYSSQAYNVTTFNMAIAMAEEGTTRFITANNTYTPSVTPTRVKLQFYIPSGTNVNVSNIKLMLVKGTTAPTEYEPYTNGASPNPDYPQDIHVVSGDNSIEVCGKNILKYPYLNTTSIVSGVTFTDNGDGSITINGTSTSSTYSLWFLYENAWNYNNLSFELNPGTYTFKGLTTNKVTMACNLYFSDNSNEYFFIAQNDVTKTITNKAKLNMRVLVNGGTTVNNVTIYPQIEVGSSSSSFEPYNGNTYPINLPVENLFDKDSATLNVGINTSNGNTYNDTNLFSTDYIPISINTTYRANSASTTGNRVFGACYDSNKSYLGAVSTGVRERVFTVTNANAKYVRITGQKVNIDTYQIEKGTKANSYTPYGTTPIELCKIGTYQDKIAKSSGKNLCNLEQLQLLVNSSGTVISSSYFWNAIIDTRNINSIYISGNYSLLGDNVLRIGGFSEYPVLDTQGTRITYSGNSALDATNYNYVLLCFTPSSNHTIEEIKKSFMVNEGTTALPYEPYGKVWYLNKQIGKVVLDGSETGWGINQSSGYYRASRYFSDIYNYNDTNRHIDKIICSHFYLSIDNAIGNLFQYIQQLIFYVPSGITTLEQWQTWLSTHNTIVYYVLATPTITKITDTTLISQLETIKKSYNTQTNISQTNADKPFILDVVALGNN